MPTFLKEGIKPSLQGEHVHVVHIGTRIPIFLFFSFHKSIDSLDIEIKSTMSHYQTIRSNTVLIFIELNMNVPYLYVYPTLTLL